MQRRPKTPTLASARGSTITRKADGDVLAMVLAVIEELKSSDQEVKSRLAETEAQLAEFVLITNHSSRSLSQRPAKQGIRERAIQTT
jgi:hypothetical protein